MFEMIHHATIYPDGTVHVQNSIMGHLGQHHVHTLQGYRRWKKDLKLKCTEKRAKEGEKCDCGFTTPGKIREYDGKEWVNDEHPEWK